MRREKLWAALPALLSMVSIGGNIWQASDRHQLQIQVIRADVTHKADKAHLDNFVAAVDGTYTTMTRGMVMH